MTIILSVQRTPNKSSCRDHSVVIATEETAVLRPELADIKQQITTTSYTLPSPSDVSAASVNSPQEPDHHILPVVHWTLKDAAKRKRNVIVIGMSEDPTTNDLEQFVTLCESFLGLSIKLYVVSEIVEGRIIGNCLSDSILMLQQPNCCVVRTDFAMQQTQPSRVYTSILTYHLLKPSWRWKLEDDVLNRLHSDKV
jgi:hypothetical protein